MVLTCTWYSWQIYFLQQVQWSCIWALPLILYFLKIFFLTVSMFVLLKCCKKYFLMTTNVTSTLALYLVVSVYFICQIQHNFSLQHSRIVICLSRCLFYIITLWLIHILVLYLYGSVIEALIHILCCFVKLVTPWLICLCVCDDVHYFCLLFSN